MIKNPSIKAQPEHYQLNPKKHNNKYDTTLLKNHKASSSHFLYPSQNQNLWNLPSSKDVTKGTNQYSFLRRTFNIKNHQRNPYISSNTQTPRNLENQKDYQWRNSMKHSKSRLCIHYDQDEKGMKSNDEEQRKKLKIDRSRKHLQIQDKYIRYISTLERFRQQIDANSEELKKLKQDRKRRIDLLQSQKKPEQQPYPSEFHRSSLSLKINKLSDFHIGKSLGQGKFGSVFQVLHKTTGHLYALKKVSKQTIKSHLIVDQFALQLKIQSFLYHQNILQLYAFFHDCDNIYLILEYMEEGTLYSYLKKHRKLSQSEVATKIRQITSAIVYLHQNSIAHRDIKPQNIVLSHGTCKLCDFGWATICSQRRRTYCGTFDYSSPQILQGQQYDQCVDLWCLGVLTYELLVGKPPFYHFSRKQTKKQILNIDNFNIKYQNLSYKAISFIQGLLKRNPNQRMSAQEALRHPFLRN